MSLPDTMARAGMAIPSVTPPGTRSPVSGGSTLSYTIDEKDTIIAVSVNWDEFARSNGSENILSTKIIGSKLDQFITGDATRMFVRTMIMSARTLNRAIYRPYRCDSPQLKRFMEMTLRPDAARCVELIHRELYSEPALYPLPLVAAPANTGWGLVKRCSLCNRIHAKGIWSEVDDAIASERLHVTTRNVKVIYGICPDCLGRRGVPL